MMADLITPDQRRLCEWIPTVVGGSRSNRDTRETMGEGTANTHINPQVDISLPSHSLSLLEAQSIAWDVVTQLPPGTTFTVKGLFGDIKVRGDPRRKQAIILTLRQRGVIVSAGVTQKDQESRNGGYATLWVVQPQEEWEAKK